MQTQARGLAVVGGAVVGGILGVVLGACLGFLFLRQSVPPGTHQQNEYDWMGGVQDSADFVQIKFGNVMRIGACMTVGGVAGLAGGIVYAVRTLRRSRSGQPVEPLEDGD